MRRNPCMEIAMSSPLDALEARVDQLVSRCEELANEKAALVDRERLWTRERARLIAKQEMMRSRLEAMIARLHALE